jgi:Protein of unknown function (DUF2798)
MNTSFSSRPVGEPASRPVSIAPRWRRLVPLFTLVPTIGLVLSGLITWLNIGWVDDFGARWMRAFFTALPVMPMGMFIMMALDRVLKPRLGALPGVAVKVVLALCTATVMEVMMASAVTFSNNGLSAGFLAQWAMAFLKSLPVGVAIGLCMAFLIKPRLERWIVAGTPS